LWCFFSKDEETPTTMARRGGGWPRRGAEQGFCEAKTVEAIIVVGFSWVAIKIKR